jgi:hypothetical protein
LLGQLGVLLRGRVELVKLGLPERLDFIAQGDLSPGRQILLDRYDEVPALTDPIDFVVVRLTVVNVWANVKNALNTAYVKSWFLSSWTPGMPMPSGNPEAKAAVQITGNGDLPRQFQNAAISMKKVASGAANIGATPVLVPGETKYAIHPVRVIETVLPGRRGELSPPSRSTTGGRSLQHPLSPHQRARRNGASTRGCAPLPSE